jgi:hypothetical protein
MAVVLRQWLTGPNRAVPDNAQSPIGVLGRDGSLFSFTSPRESGSLVRLRIVHTAISETWVYLDHELSKREVHVR